MCQGTFFHLNVRKEVNMINFDEEIAKFQPSLEVDQAEDVINNNDLSDITDIIKTMLKDLKDK
ncbi:hypothetical protein Ana3638_00980 [Anaerocolumna sedimenticola]|uniref:Uncharacterized protein n=1 Tax=Anaerocolumna sedimenticola TaxID=2696063 RepID=A0A6P1TGJ3_9FIRM|nr:hypothetical protein [Anaerocolumna sedimenticola]QHQ59543.1 hypothetical protein Ana3638_00980 [Anaerocolumna sedimenticola]